MVSLFHSKHYRVSSLLEFTTTSRYNDDLENFNVRLFIKVSVKKNGFLSFRKEALFLSCLLVPNAIVKELQPDRRRTKFQLRLDCFINVESSVPVHTFPVMNVAQASHVCSRNRAF